MPTGRLTMEYCPDPSVTAVLIFSISAGLATSTETPGSARPDESLTEPAIVPSPWAELVAGSPSRPNVAKTAAAILRRVGP